MVCNKVIFSSNLSSPEILEFLPKGDFQGCFSYFLSSWGFLCSESDPRPGLLASSLILALRTEVYLFRVLPLWGSLGISAFPLLTLSHVSDSLMQVEDRFRKTNHSSPEAQSKQTGRVLEPPVPSRSESFSNGNSEAVHPALQRPAEPQVEQPFAGGWGDARRGSEPPACLTCSLWFVLRFRKRREEPKWV